MGKNRIGIFAAILCLGLASCVDVRESQYQAPLEEPEDSHPAPIKFTRLKVDLPLGQDIGIFRINCFLHYFQVDGKIFQGVSQKLTDDSFTLALEQLGYDVVSVLNKDFDEEIADELLRSEYKISAKIVDADISACNDASPGFFEQKFTQFKGKLYLKIEWAVYDNLRKKVVYRATTDGYTHQKSASSEGLNLMLSDAFSMAAHNLGTDQDFHDLIFYGRTPPDDWKLAKDKKKRESRPRIFDPTEKVIVRNRALSRSPLPDHIEETRQIAVLVQSGAGHGSGFFITDQGHILTNQHVAGDARRVRIVTADREDKLIAEVLRVDKIRDVALLRLEDVPKGMQIITAPVQTEWPKVSADIYALGAPSNKRMQDTLTKGIVSAHRKNFRLSGRTLDFIQGDVQTIGGNSGGPLLDQYGNVVGLSVAGLYQYVGESDSGLNLFIPIGDALTHLGVEIR